jgi:hypothetical protein
MELLRLGLQFFAEGENEEEETETPYISEGTGSKTSYGDYMVENNRVDENTYYANNNFLGTQKEWEDYYGYDADRDYQNTVNTLNYEYQTSMANYGENAEKMYQMGLQNSGVSDIFQANAFSAYLGNMNQAAADRINAKNQFKRDYARYQDDFKKSWTDYDAITQSGYKSYSDNYDSTLKTNAINGYTAVLSSGLFSGEGIEGYEATEGASVGAGFKDYNKVSNYLKNLGYDDVTIEEVWKKLARMDLAGLTTDRINAGYLNSMDIYDGSEESETRLRTTLAAMKLTESEIDQIVTRHKDEWNASDDGKAAAVNNFVTTYGEQYDPNMSKEEFVNKMITKEDGTLDESQRANAEAAWEQMSADYDSNIEAATRRAEELYRGATYTVTDENGNKITKQYVKGVIEKLIKEGYSKAVANAAAQKLIGQDPTIYKERAGKQAYADAMNRLGIESVDLTKYSSWEAYKTAITNSLQGTDWSKDSVNYAIKNAKNAWDDAKRSIVAAIANHFAERIKAGISESQIKKELSDEGYSNELITEGYSNYTSGTTQGVAASVEDLIDTWGDKFDPSMNKEEFVNLMITKDGKIDESQRANAEAAWEQMSADYKAKQPERVQAIVDTFGIGEGKIDPSSFESKEAFINEMKNNNHSAEDAEAAWNKFDEAAGKAYNKVWEKYQVVDDTGALINTYTGNTKQKLDIKNLLGADVPEYIYNEIIKRMDANRAEEKEADKQVTLTEIENLPEDKVNYNTLYNEIQNSGNDPDITAASSVKLKDAVMGVLNDDTGEKLVNAYELIPNMTKQAWDALDDAGKLDALLNGIGEAHKTGVIIGNDYYSIIGKWVDSEIENHKGASELIDTITRLQSFKDKGYLSGYYYNDYLDKVSAEFTLDSAKLVTVATDESGNDYFALQYKVGNDIVKMSFKQSKIKNNSLGIGFKVDGGKLYNNGNTLLFVDNRGNVYEYNSKTPINIGISVSDENEAGVIVSVIKNIINNSSRKSTSTLR